MTSQVISSSMLSRPQVERLSDVAPIEQAFREVLEPLYGSQDEALRKIRDEDGRKTFVVVENGDAKGILCYKTEPSDEYRTHGVVNSIEIKSLFLFYPTRDSGKGLGKMLLNFMLTAFPERDTIDGFHVTVSEDTADSLKFFTCNGFEKAAEMSEKYQRGKVEYLLSKRIKRSSSSPTEA